MADFTAWKNSVLGQVLDSDGVKGDTGQCSQVPVSWALYCFPGKKWSDLLPAIGSDKGVDDWAGKSTQYFTWIENNHSDVNQLPLQGDIGVSGPTPSKGYSDTFTNSFGHTWVFDSASVSGFTAVQQNAPHFGDKVNDSSYGWHVIPVLGWFRAVNAVASAPVPAPSPAPTNSVNVGRTLHLPAKNADGSPDSVWHVYNPNGPYDIPHATNILDPAKFGGEAFPIQKDLGNGIYLINTQDFGQKAIWTKGTNATIS